MRESKQNENEKIKFERLEIIAETKSQPLSAEETIEFSLFNSVEFVEYYFFLLIFLQYRISIFRFSIEFDYGNHT